MVFNYISPPPPLHGKVAPGDRVFYFYAYKNLTIPCLCPPLENLTLSFCPPSPHEKSYFVSSSIIGVKIMTYYDPFSAIVSTSATTQFRNRDPMIPSSRSSYRFAVQVYLIAITVYQPPCDIVSNLL